MSCLLMICATTVELSSTTRKAIPLPSKQKHHSMALLLILGGLGAAILATCVCLLPMGGWKEIFRSVMRVVAEPALAPTPEGVQCQRDIVYATTEDGANLFLDLFVPDEDKEAAGDPLLSSIGGSLPYGSDGPNVRKREGPLPVVIFIFGGSWFAGNRYQVQLFSAQDWLVKAGYALVSCEYRLSPTHRFPAQIHDVKAVVRWVRKHAEQFNLDPERIGVWGPSAGGHLASLLATTGDSGNAVLEGEVGGEELAGTSTKVHCCVDYFGPQVLKDLTDFKVEWIIVGRESTNPPQIQVNSRLTEMAFARACCCAPPRTRWAGGSAWRLR